MLKRKPVGLAFINQQPFVTYSVGLGFNSDHSREHPKSVGLTSCRLDYVNTHKLRYVRRETPW